jgi:cytochrome c oxidase subunit I+III
VGLNPTSHAHPATVWLLVAWTILHVAVGILMQLYCLLRRLAGHLTRGRDMEIENVVLYWHFAIFTSLVTVAVIAVFPLLT